MRPSALGALLLAATAPVASPTLAQTLPVELVQIDENGLWHGNLPGAPSTASVTAEQMRDFFAQVQAENIEHRYIVGSCEDRAHLVTMIAQAAGLPISKVWAVAPARMSLLSQELIRFTDPYGVTSEVTWGHHVAPLVLVGHGGADRVAMVVDLSLSPDAPMPLRDWIAAIGTPRATFFATSSNDYLFWSANGFIAANNTGRDTFDANGVKDPATVRLPGWFPNILTGDFQKYDEGKWDETIADGLAKNDLAMAVFDGVLDVDAQDQAALRETIKYETSMTRLVDDPDSVGISPVSVVAVRSFYGRRISHWSARLASLK